MKSASPLWAGMVTAAVVLLAGCAAAVSVPEFQPYTPSVPSATPVVEVPPPIQMSIPSIGASSTLLPLGLKEDGSHEVPEVTRPEQAGWYEPGYEPGEPGPAILLGHVNGGGVQGVFYDLRKVKKGDLVNVDDRTFIVYNKESVPKDSFPADKVYAETGVSELRLITCGGAFDGASYVNNIIVYAELIE